VKRLMGRKWDSPIVASARENYPYRLIQGPHNDVRIKIRDVVYSPPEISAIILQELRVVAEEYLGQQIQKAVVTVPAYFNDNQRQATKDAGTIAGLDVIRIINEPTAAALAYGFGKKIDRLVAVYDLGGGTFDISILEIGAEGVFRVVATAGDTFLGGEDFDNRILGWIIKDFEKEHNLDLRGDRMALQRIKDAAENAKCELSQTKKTEINLPFIITSPDGEPLHIQVELSREKLQELVSDLIDRTIEICEATLEEAGIAAEDIQDTLLVGGMTRVPRVQKRVAELFEREPCKGVNPDEVVALGAAIQGDALLSEESDVILLDVTPHTLGIMVAGGFFEDIIPLNTTVPTARSKIFTTVHDNQTAVKILVLQGESKQAEENELLGEFILDGLRPAPKGEVEVEVTFEINSDGIVSVSAKNLETGLKQSITVTATSGLTSEEIKDMMRQGKEYMVERRLSEKQEEKRQSIERLLSQLNDMYPGVEEMISSTEQGQEALDKVRSAIEKAEKVVESGDEEEMDRTISVLQRTFNMFQSALKSS
ncbi:MAG: molecular chaperone DnaK, partial [Deltaproteobacteria bacterium]|nr:molecular chaperone DnaK [Deltaproteobacteria bacterium]